MCIIIFKIILLKIIKRFYPKISCFMFCYYEIYMYFFLKRKIILKNS